MGAMPAKAAVQKPAISGLKPPSPDQNARPASALQPKKWDAVPEAPQVSDADRARRLAQSDPQGRYGNSEVARVAVQQNPAPIGARKAPAGKLPEAGTQATGAKRNVGGRGKPSANPGAAKAAVEAKHKGDKEKASKGTAKIEPKPKDKPPASKGGAEGGAKEDQKKSKDKEGAAGEGGASGGAGESSASAGAGGDMGAVSAPPPQRPRLEGTDATILSVPVLADQQRERVRAQTGLTVAEHYARAQVHLDRLSARAKSEQLAIVLHIELIEAEVRRDLENTAALIGPAVEAGIDRVRGSCAAARADINAASKEAMAIVETHANDADQKVDAAALSSKDAVDKAVKKSSPAIRALHEETMKPIREMLGKQGDAFKEAAKKQGEALITKADELAPHVDSVSGDPIAKAIAEKKYTVAHDNMKEAQQGFLAAGERARLDILAQEPSLSLSFLMFVNPVSVKVEHIGGADGKTVVEKGGEVRLRLATDYERSKGYITETTKRALKALDALEQQGVKFLREMGRSLEGMAKARCEQLCSSILAGQAPAADAWAQQMKGVNELVADRELVDIRRLEPRFVEALDSMNALSARQRLDFDSQARSGFDEARAGMDEDRRGIDESADSFISSARDTRRQADTMRQYGATLSKGFQAVAKVSGANAQEFQTRSEEKLGLVVTDTRKQMEDLCKNTGETMAKAAEKFGTVTLAEQGKKVAANVYVMVMGVDIAVWNDLADRASRCVKAMDKVGTDETGLFEALYAMTPIYGEALCDYWNKADHRHDLWWWLEDELSGDEYWTAYYYLKGDPVKGAYFQMKASIHWYGDDVTQIESGLRALTPDQLKALDKDYPGARKTLEDNLKGTNLLVVQALLAGRTARADALRLKEGIDAARAAGNDDKLHDLLSKIDPKRLPEVRTEFVDILAKNPMLEKAPVSPKEGADLDKENAAFVKYITDPVKVIRPPAGPHSPPKEVTLTLSEPSKQLAKALATTGEGSPESRAARLAFEKQRGGKPRPEKLALALDDPELVAARKNPILKQPNAKAEDVKDAQEHLARLEERRSEMMKQFATLTKADGEIAKDPERAKQYTTKAVADMFGDDDLGRELGSSMVEKGRANPAVAIKYAVRGWGTNEELIRKTLKGMSAAEIEEMTKEYSDRFDKGNPNKLYQDLGVFQNDETAKAAGLSGGVGGDFFTELSGDERQEVEELLLGKPENDRDRMRLARMKYQHQKGEGSTWATGLLVSAVEPNESVMGQLPDHMQPPGNFASKSLDMNKSKMEEMIRDAGGEKEAFDKDGNFKGVPGKHSINDFRLRVAATGEMAENYKHHIDSICDMITGAIAIIGAIVGTIVVTVLTLGTATPLVVGLWAAGIAAATGAAVMATKYALKGSRYGWEEAAVDGAMTLVDAATAGLTAGAGAKAARAATQLAAIKAAARTPAQEAIAANLVKQHARKELVRGFGRSAGSAFVSGTARTATQDGIWDEGVLTGLGRSVKGGASAAAVGLATHGATHKFSQSRFGQSLGQSTSYFKRGLGSGLGGAVGGMAGRTTELSLDALGGHAQGSWYDALGSIALAGGRGFAENFGQGMAEVPKARRDAAQEHANEMRKKSDNERVAREGMSDADVAADARFQHMAAAAALANDPKTNVKAFLTDLETSVAHDRSVVEANRRLVSEFRREALASIPKERRGEFADVPIHVLPDAQFEKFTGSQSGRAVTIFVDGEAQILVRKSATPETLREEGIHVLQSRDPKWREKIGRLDEKTMSRWHELDLETQLSLYKDKVEVEIDAHQRLRKDLLDEAGATTDPARRKKLLTQAEEAAGTHKSLKARQDEVATIGPDRIAAMKDGKEARPQYLREPARLFSKKVLAATDLGPSELDPESHKVKGKPLRHEHDLSQEDRYEVDYANSTWSNDHPANYKVRQVGGAWSEPDATAPGGKRWYRMAELYDDQGNFVDRRREILQLEENRADGVIRWQQRGSETSERGSLHEQVSRQRTLAEARQRIIEERRAAGTLTELGEEFSPDRDSVVPIGALRARRDKSGKPLSAQHSGGAGFDDVKFEFRKVGGRWEATIVIIEAKGYRRSLSLEDFSAITANMTTNLAELRKQIQKSNLSDSRKEAIYRAIAARDLSFELHLSPSSKLGRMKFGGTIIPDIKDTEMARRHMGAVKEQLKEAMRNTSLSNEERQELVRDSARVDALAKQLNDAYSSKTFDPAKVRSALDAILDKKNRNSVTGMARHHGFGLDERAVNLQRLRIDAKGKEARYAREAAALRAKTAARTQSTLAMARDARIADKTLRVVPTAHTAPADVTLTQSADKKRSLAITRPILGTPGGSGESEGVGVAARQIVKLLRDGVPVPGGQVVHPDKLLWDAGSASPAQIERVLDKVRRVLRANNGDPTRLHVLVENTVANTEAKLRSELSLPAVVEAKPVTRSPEGTPTWVLLFPTQWLDDPKRGRRK